MPISEADYEAIESAVKETVRGRWFLEEYARRNRHADTRMLLRALERIEGAIRGAPAGGPVDRIRVDLFDMAKSIARTKAEIAAIKPDSAHHGRFGDATAELDSIVMATEKATSDILAAAEQVQEIAWTLREQGLAPEICDLIDSNATNIYTACSFQDLTGQRTRKVIAVLAYLEARIKAMIEIWDLNGAMAAEAAEAVRATRGGDSVLLSGPARPGEGLDQADVDIVMGPAVAAASSTVQPCDDLTIVEADPSGSNLERTQVAHATSETRTKSQRPASTTALTVYRAALAETTDLSLALHERPQAPDRTAPTPAAAAGDVRATPSTVPESDPLAPIIALSDEEKIALFS
jgi:chemotaxis regulatin CheY-phosphate phosphatase CheZ